MRTGSKQKFASTLPPDRFYCLLDELPLHLIPRPHRELLRPMRAESLVLNPACDLLAASQLPNELAQRAELVSGFAFEGALAWVGDSATENRLPFWLGPGLEAAVRKLRSGSISLSDLDDDVCGLLCGAGILHEPARQTTHRARREANLRQAASLFRERGYAPLTGLIHPFHIAALRRYARHQIRRGAVPLGDRQSPRRYAAYNDPVARFFHHQVAKTLSVVAGESLRPSYVYMASYLSGAELKKHTDREQCEFSVTLCLDFSPEPARETPWPIRLDTRLGSVTIYQALGDGLAYRGTRLPHYRDPLGEGQTSTSIFFHYVDEKFAGPLQ